MDDLTQFCAPGTRCDIQNIAVNECVTLRVITFSPPQPTDNPVIVFVPGWISLVPGWKAALIEMTRDFRIHYIETREKISSTIHGKVQFRVEDFAHDLALIIESLGLEEGEYLLCGSSLGATAIVDSCRFLKQRPRGLILIGVNAVFHIPKFWQMVVHLFPPRLYLLMKPVIKWYLRNFRLDVESDRAQYEKYCRNIEAADPWKLKKAALAFVHYAIWERLPEIEIPTLLIAATKDELHDLQNIHRIHAALANSRYLDLGTNSQTHNAAMVVELRNFVRELR